MYGFQLIENGKKQCCDSIIYHNIEYRNFMIHKFEGDKCFQNLESYIIILDGVILNRKVLQAKYNENNWPRTLSKMYESVGDDFFKELRGSFAGAFYDKKEEKHIIFTDQLGSKFIYYSQIGDFFCCSQVMGSMYDLLKENHIPYNLDITASKIMLTYGFMIEDYTLCKEVKKIEPGCYLILKNGKISLNRYYMLDNTPDNSITEGKAIEEIERLFKQAVTREFEKDKEYGYKHICALSGGLDCRMTTFVSHKCGYDKQLNCTFSQSEYLDHTLAQKMASDLKHEWIFKALDNGIWLYDVDEVTRTTGGNVLYYGTAHGNSLWKYMNFDKLGLLHSGQIGDITISTHSSDERIKYKLGNGAYSKRFISTLNISLKLSDLNEELGFYYYRALNGTNNGIQNIYNYTETLSPFMDLDFLEFALKIPAKIRYNHHLYKKWILSKYPEAADYVWETTGCRINTKMVKFKNGEKPLRKIPELILARLGLKKRGTNSQKHMNPVGYYITHNKDLYDYLNGYIKYIDYVPNEELSKEMKVIITQGTPMEKIQLVTILAAIKLYYAE